MLPRTVIFLVLLLIAAAIAEAVPGQCNLGLKLFSIENGKAICAPFVPFKCVESCEWNTTCENTSHWHTFGGGRRSFVQGMLLTNSVFYVQCCASMATFVGRNDPCIWTTPIDVVVGHGSIRTEPVLRSNEYIRDITVDRPQNHDKSSVVKMRLELCKFSVQREHCNKEAMEENDRRFYELLLLRLSRSSLLLRQKKTTETTVSIPVAARNQTRADVILDSDSEDVNQIGNALSQMRDENPIVVVNTASIATSPERRCKQRSKRMVLTSESGEDAEECHREFKSCCEEKLGHKCKEICSLKVDRSTIFSILKKRNCAVLNLISVLQCFNQFYDTSSVIQCCRSPERKISSRCLDACSPHFKLSYKHIRCIDSVVDVYDCYRTLFPKRPMLLQ